MAKPTFQPLHRDGHLMDDAIEYTPLVYIAGTAVHRLALHRSYGSRDLPNSSRGWQVSDPASGGCIIGDVGGTYKGMPVSSRGMTLRDARANAMAALDSLLGRIGSTAFNDRLEAARLKYARHVDDVNNPAHPIHY